MRAFSSPAPFPFAVVLHDFSYMIFLHGFRHAIMSHASTCFCFQLFFFRCCSLFIKIFNMAARSKERAKERKTIIATRDKQKNSTLKEKLKWQEDKRWRKVQEEERDGNQIRARNSVYTCPWCLRSKLRGATFLFSYSAPQIHLSLSAKWVLTHRRNNMYTHVSIWLLVVMAKAYAPTHTHWAF